MYSAPPPPRRKTSSPITVPYVIHFATRLHHEYDPLTLHKSQSVPMGIQEGIKYRVKGLWEDINDVRTSLILSMGYEGVYYWDRNINFGDLLSPAIFDYFDIPHIHSPPHLADVASTGSILGHLPDDFDGRIVGSGFIEAGPPVSLPLSDVVSLRGHLSNKRLSHKSPSFLGDPGLLVSDLYDYTKRSKYTLGVIPNIADKGLDVVREIDDSHDSIKIIDVQRSPDMVLRDISDCENTISSSLHGIIASHSLGIPSAWAKLSDNVVGGSYKFRDYFSIYNETPTKVDIYKMDIAEVIRRTEVPDITILEETKAKYRDVFNHYSSSLETFM